MGAIHDAAAAGDCQTIIQELEKNPHLIDALDGSKSQGLTPLQNAVTQNRVEAVNLLLSRKANVNMRSKNNFTALAIVCTIKSNRFDDDSRTIMIQKLIQNGAKFDFSYTEDVAAFALFKQKFPTVYARVQYLVDNSDETHQQSSQLHQRHLTNSNSNKQ